MPGLLPERLKIIIGEPDKVRTCDRLIKSAKFQAKTLIYNGINGAIMPNIDNNGSIIH